MTIADYGQSIYGKLDLSDLALELRKQCRSVNDGDMVRPEAVLLSQAMTLDIVFNDLARRAAANRDRPDTFERLLRLAFKAQSQSRATLETLANIKNPPLVVARQANIANGPQQVNNGASPAREVEIQQNKLLESDHGHRLDTRTACETGCVDRPMEAMGKVDRPSHA